MVINQDLSGFSLHHICFQGCRTLTFCFCLYKYYFFQKRPAQMLSVRSLQWYKSCMKISVLVWRDSAKPEYFFFVSVILTPLGFSFACQKGLSISCVVFQAAPIVQRSPLSTWATGLGERVMSSWRPKRLGDAHPWGFIQTIFEGNSAYASGRKIWMLALVFFWQNTSGASGFTIIFLHVVLPSKVRLG